MQRPLPDPNQEVTIRDLYPDLTPKQQEEAEYFLDRYLSVVRRIYERTHNLTEKGGADTLLGPEGE
jgi:hypothetical protein